MKNILLVSQNFFPESFKSNDIAFELQKNGYNVSVLTGIPNYPQGKYTLGYGIFKKRFEIINGVKIYRCFQIPRGKHFVKFLLPFTYLSFMIFGSFWALYLSFFNKYDVIFVHQVSPITQTLPAIIVKKIQKIPIILWVLDLWPDAFISGSGINYKPFNILIDKYVSFSYNNSDIILIGSKSFHCQIKNKNPKLAIIEYFPNWAEDCFESSEKRTLPNLQSGFKIMLAGNLGVSQNLDNVMKVAKALKNENISWVLLGDGSKKKWLEDYIKDNSLENNVKLLGKFPIESMPSFYTKADLMLLSLGSEYEDLKLVVPARLQSYMAVGKPILGFIDGASAELIQEAQCGFTVGASDVNGLINVIKNEILPNKFNLVSMGINGKIYYNEHFKKSNRMLQLQQIINSLPSKK